LKVKYENGSANKNLTITIDSVIKRDFTLTKNVDQDILIPISGVKQIEFSTNNSSESEASKRDHRNLGFSLESISLIKNNSVFVYTVDKVLIENELSEFCSFTEEEKDLNKMVDFDRTNQSVNDDFKLLKSKITQIRVKNESEFKGITYIGQHGTSGYATAAKGNLIHFFTKGIPISWIPLYFDNSQLSDECFYNAMIKSLIKKPIDTCDTVFLHCTPDLWPEMRNRYKDLMKDKRVIGYTVWETNKLPYLWVESINDCVDEVWCPSSYNQFVFKESGVKIPVKVFPHVFMPKELPSKKSVLMNLLDGEVVNTEDSYYTFYNISELNPRKGVEDLVKTFCDAFSSKDKVRLILKVHYKNYEDSNKKYCINVLNTIISSYVNPPKIHVILNNLTEREILGLHSIGDCYVSLCKSEGFGLTIFEAFKYDKKVITTGYGGRIDFLGKNYEGLVKYKIGNVVGMDSFAKHYSEEQKWAYPDLKHAKELMIKATK
jgi:glycosyltransferase involved in cell wall biosynthesis